MTTPPQIPATPPASPPPVTASLPHASSESLRRSPFARFMLICATISVLCSAIIAYGIFSFFRMDRSVRTLRDAILDAEPGRWSKQGEVNVGPLSADLLKFGLHFAPMDRDARTALDAFRSAQFAMYHLDHGGSHINRSRLLTRADEAMKGRGWERCVGVINNGEFVAIYVPHDGPTPSRIEACVVVIDQRQMFVGSTSANANAVFALIDAKHPHLPLPFH